VLVPDEAKEPDASSNVIDAGALSMVVAVRGNYQNMESSESAGLSQRFFTGVPPLNRLVTPCYICIAGVRCVQFFFLERGAAGC